MPGPLPDPHSIRRNAPTIPTTELRVSGRQGEIPEPPGWIELFQSGCSWWEWAWTTPQAIGWGDSVGMDALVGRRASLEDDLAAIEFVDNLDLLDDEFQSEKAKALRDAVQRLAAMATGRLAIMREMRELDDRLGLSPKGLAQLRWKIVADPEAATETPGASDEVGERRSRRERLAAGE